MPNVFSDDLPDRADLDRPGFRSRRRRVGERAGAQRLGASIWEVPPGELAYPYHYHLAEEELLVVLSGHGELRTPDGWRALTVGEVIAFPVGEAGAHQLRCPGPDALRFLCVSTHGAPDIVVYPDSDKVGANSRGAGGSDLQVMFRRADAVDYWDGESPGAVPS